MDWDEIKNYPAYACTIKDAPAPRDIENELEKVGIRDIRLVYGIDGRTAEGAAAALSKAEELGISPEGFANAGQLAPYLAFQEALQSFLSSGKSHMLWFEDDAIPHKHFDKVKKSLLEITNWKESNVVYLGGATCDGSDDLIKKLDSGTLTTDVTTRMIVLAHALIIDRAAAEELVSKKQPACVIDLYIRRVVRLSYRLKSMLLLIPPGLSDDTKNIKDWKSAYDDQGRQALLDANPDRQVLIGSKSNIPCFGAFFQKISPSINTAGKRLR